MLDKQLTELLSQPGLSDDQLAAAAKIGGRIFLAIGTIAVAPALYKNILVTPHPVAWLYGALWLVAALFFGEVLGSSPRARLSLLAGIFAAVAIGIIVQYDGLIQMGLGFAVTAVVILNIVYGTRTALGASTAFAVVGATISIHGGQQSGAYIVTAAVSGLVFCAFPCIFVSLVLRSLTASARELQVAVRRQRETAEAGNIALFEHDTVTDVFKVNDIFRKIWELPESAYPVITADIMLQRSPPELRDDRGEFVEQMQQSSEATDKPVQDSDVGELLMPDGSLKWVQVQFEPEHVKGYGTIIRGSAIDVTEKYVLEQQLQELLADIESRARLGQVALFSQNITRDTYNVNSVFRELYDLPEDEFPVLSATLIKQRIVSEQHALADALTQAKHSVPERNEYEWEIVRRDGSHRFIKVVLVTEVLANGDVTCKGAVVDQTAAVLRQKDLEEQRQLQSRMFAIIAHELRTPAAAIKMLAGDEELYRSSHKELLTSAEHQLQVIDDLRQAVNPDREIVVRIEPFSPADVMLEVTRQIKPLAMDANMYLKTEVRLDAPDINYLSDAYRIRSILTNLLRNACYHSNGSMIQVTVSSSPLPDDRARIAFAVEDDGKGVPENDVDRLFEAFERGDTAAGGTGVGLYLVRSWAEKLNGSIAYSTSRLGGACFSVAFDLNIAGAQDFTNLDDMVVAAKRHLEGRKVLMVEDDPILRRIQKKVLEKNFDLQLQVAEDATTALAMIEETSPDLVLTDYFMPEVSGADLIRTLRGQGLTIPVIALTAATIGSEQQELYDAGADRVLAKPLDVADFSRVVVDVFSSDETAAKEP